MKVSILPLHCRCIAAVFPMPQRVGDSIELLVSYLLLLMSLFMMSSLCKLQASNYIVSCLLAIRALCVVVHAVRAWGSARQRIRSAGLAWPVC